MATKRNIGRQELANIIPIQTPFTAFIEPTNRCNFRCRFCPTSQPDLLKGVNRPVGDMPMEFAKELINQFAMFPDKLKILSFQYMGEPLLNPHITDIIGYAVSRNVSSWYEIQTNGYLLNPEINRRLVNAGINRVGISVEALDNDGYRRICGIKKFDIARFIDNLMDLYENRGDNCEVFIKIVDTGLTNEEKAKFYELFSPMADDIKIEYLIDWNRSGNYDFKLGIESGKMVKGNDPYYKKACGYPFYTLGVTWHGEVVLCCVDWSYATSVGNAHNQSLLQIWHGEKLKKFQIMHLENRRSENPACSTCTGIYMQPDNIDDKRDEIKLRLLK